MMIGGDNVDKALVEIVDMSNPSFTPCPTPAKVTESLSGGVATLFQGKVVACGGMTTNKCHEYSFASNQWTPILTLDKSRVDAMSVMVDAGTWWIAGND